MNIEDVIKENSELLDRLQSDNQRSSIDVQLTQMREQLNYLQQIDMKRQLKYDQLLNQSVKLQQLFIELMRFVNDSNIRGNQFNTILRQYNELSFRSPVANERSPCKPSSPFKKQKNYMAIHNKF
ncbi:unnamed protein product (macronuclear) [Paramecium tetraurelia]|uniref:Uncharacterized protein n=1 Tax=Paramecium tetraurelia TaxID=5888 RepID=A0E070_PARTE|nr:uncharacterized protein GSPATT00021855001 [Paramecium tetraurelia]CAK88687.1 unnamed protein product [Paramecium tetraurelia]|eukprot:XP_001456084.1 hypothetical protein (macronuclear) [Paramecium tetraurelia strain d4-2]